VAKAAFGVFYWLEVMDFGSFFIFLFLCLVLHVTFHVLVVRVVSVAPRIASPFKHGSPTGTSQMG
jgi:hypothetical protein